MYTDKKSPADREAVLVVDDEPVVLKIVCSILEQAGFEVLSAASPDDALRIGALRDEPIRLLLCDVIMPGKSGPTVAEHFSRLHPETVCLFMAGYPESPEVVERILSRGRAFLPKPFAPKTLVGKVREVLSASADQAMATTA